MCHAMFILYRIIDDSSYILNFDLGKLKEEQNPSPQLERAC
jgi:hypothetical protein